MQGRMTSKFLFVGNHPCLDFINTQVMQAGRPVDLLERPSDLLAWLEEARLMDRASSAGSPTARAEDQSGDRLLDRVKAFRAVLREMVERIVSGRPAPASAVEAINRLLTGRTGHFQLVRTGRRYDLQFRTAADRATGVLGVLAEAAADLLSRADLSLVKKCQNPACILYFYDTTKNHARHWCSMRLCGNRMKVAAYYRRMHSTR